MPAIHALLAARKDVDGRDKRGHDEGHSLCRLVPVFVKADSWIFSCHPGPTPKAREPGPNSPQVEAWESWAPDRLAARAVRDDRAKACRRSNILQAGIIPGFTDIDSSWPANAGHPRLACRPQRRGWPRQARP